MSKEYTRAGRKFCIEAFPRPTVMDVTTFTQEEWQYISAMNFSPEHFNFLCDQKARDFRYVFVPDQLPDAQRMAIEQSEEILKALRGDTELKRILDF
jgi:hypothetical protein